MQNYHFPLLLHLCFKFLWELFPLWDYNTPRPPTISSTSGMKQIIVDILKSRLCPMDPSDMFLVWRMHPWLFLVKGCILLNLLKKIILIFIYNCIHLLTFIPQIISLESNNLPIGIPPRYCGFHSRLPQ